MWLLIGDVVAHWRCGDYNLEMWLLMEMWLLIGDVVAHWRCGGSLEMRWLIGDVVAQCS